MSSEMMDNLFLSAPIIVLVVACAGIVRSVLKNRKYLIGFIFLLIGGGIYYWGLYVGKWEGIAISLFIGGGMVLLGLLTLLITVIYSKAKAAKKRRGLS
ncbi:hypothetical protein [Planococcus dechangensis]|uniref:YesK-like protein n=1 Tax=Planococcus dechangensis TaxID=1176255 RepID=A0ABV9MGD3_9BACL